MATAKATQTPKSATPAKAAAAKPARMTAAQKRQLAEAQHQQQMAEWEARRPQEWLKLWAKAMRLELMTRGDYQMDQMREANSWWFDDFSVDAEQQSFTIEVLGGHMVNETRLYASDVERINASLDHAYSMRQDYLDELERQRQAELERERLRKAALEKLTPEERKALGLR